jgi:hypothetical protein
MNITIIIAIIVPGWIVSYLINKMLLGIIVGKPYTKFDKVFNIYLSLVLPWISILILLIGCGVEKININFDEKAKW